MADSINTTRDFITNGQTIPAGDVTVEQIRDTMRIQEKDSTRPMTEVEAKHLMDDLKRRQGQYNKYREGITERHEFMGNAGSVAVGSGAE